MTIHQRVLTAFGDRYGVAPAFLVRAPGRVYLIGEHTDYSDSFLMPLAINRAMWLAPRLHADGQVSIHSLDFGQTVAFELRRLTRAGEGG